MFNVLWTSRYHFPTAFYVQIHVPKIKKISESWRKPIWILTISNRILSQISVIYDKRAQMLIKWAFCKLHDPESDPLFLCAADCNKIYHTNALILRQYFRLTILAFSGFWPRIWPRKHIFNMKTAGFHHFPLNFVLFFVCFFIENKKKNCQVG